MENITFGSTYTEKYLSEDAKHGNTRVTKVTKTNYGYLINMFNNFITLYTVKLMINADGSAKAIVKVRRNYCAPYQCTYYFAPDGREIKDYTNNGARERIAYNELRKQLTY